MGKKEGGRGGHLCLFVICVVVSFLAGCSHFNGGFRANSAFQEAHELFNQGSYQASVKKYAQIVEAFPKAGDRGLFQMGVIYAHPKNDQKDYQRALDSFEKLIRVYPASGFRQDSEMMVFYINNVLRKDNVIAAQQAQIATLQQELSKRGNEIDSLRQEIEELERTLSASPLPQGPADKILIEKKARRLTLLSNGEVIKTYKIALGGNPEGPKERQGDNKTPEGTYIIDSRNKNSQFHLSLHISYPNEADQRRASELGVSPGGDIMIHGIKKGMSWVGDLHTQIDWTKGCIAVTDEEIEEIDKLVPNGTVVEIRP